ncbi:MAG: gamma-glutamyltransferase family protein [Thermoprotei archaeon]
MFKSPFYSLSGVVASEHPLASLMGSYMLREGNAVDAAIATSLTLAVTLPHLGGIGGDFFALVRDPNGKVFFVDGSGYAPRRLTREFMRSKGYKKMPEYGVFSINVPGMVDGLWLMWRKWGSIEWSRIVSSVVPIALRGFGVTRSLANSLEKLYDSLSRDPGSKKTYYGNGIPKPGDKIAFPGLAEALRIISTDPRSFYEGEIAEAIASYVKEQGGVLDIEDLRSYRASIGTPLRITYRDRVVYEMPPSTQGITTLHMLMLLEEYELDRLEPHSSKRIEILLECARIAYSIRDTYVTDPRYMTVKPEDMLTREFIEKHRNTASRPYSASGGDTTFFAVADQEGYLVAGIQSLFYPFGSRVTEPRFNVTLNSRASSFSLEEDHVNKLEPWKKTMHTLSAVIIEDTNRVIALGLSGGHYRPLLHAQLIINIIDYNMDPQEAIEYPRIIWRVYDDIVEYEEGLQPPSSPRYSFIKRAYPSRLGVAAIAEIRDNGIRAGYTDIRGDGLPIGIP